MPPAAPTGWIGVDLDGTLAEYGQVVFPEIGIPLQPMVTRVLAWLADGWEVRIFTARVGPTTLEECQAAGYPCLADCVQNQIERINTWSMSVFGLILPVTAVKDFNMVQLWDDRAIQVVTNVGEPVALIAGAEGTVLSS